MANGTTNRLVVDFEAALKGDERRDVVLLDGDQVIIPRQAESAYVVGEVASPFATFRVKAGDKVSDILKMAGGFTRNADQSQVRLLKADGRILDSWVESRDVEPGDAVLVPQRFRLNTTWQDNLNALTPAGPHLERRPALGDQAVSFDPVAWSSLARVRRGTVTRLGFTRSRKAWRARVTRVTRPSSERALWP